MVVTDDLELDAVEAEFVAALAAVLPVRVLRRALPPSLRPASFRGRMASRGVTEADWTDTPLAPLAPAPPPSSLLRLREGLFEESRGGGLEVDDGAVELVTAPGEAAEVRSIARRLLREAARGVGFEDMGVFLPRPETYAPLFTDLLSRLGIPHRLHPSLPLRFGRAARSLLLLFRCRGLERPAVMEFLTFAPVPFEVLLGPDVPPRPARWDEMSREAGIVSGLSRWILGLRAWGEAEREAGEQEKDPDRRERRLRHVTDAEALLRVVELLGGTLDALDGEASWAEWVDRLRTVVDQWIGPERDRDAVLEMIADLGGLESVVSRAPWTEVEQVLEARFEWERLPLEPLEGGAVHIGALDAMAGLPFRVAAIPGLVEGGYPGVFRPDPFLLDSERLALRDRRNLSVIPRAVLGRRSRDPPALPPPRAQAPVPADPLLPLPPSSPCSLPRRAPMKALRNRQPKDGQIPRELRSRGCRTASSRRAASSTARCRRRPSGSSSPIPAPTRAPAARGCRRSSSPRPPRPSRAVRSRAPSSRGSWSRTTSTRLPLEDATDAGERDRIRLRAGRGRRHRDRRRLGVLPPVAAREPGPLVRPPHARTTASSWARETRACAPGSTRSPRAFPVSASRLATYARCGFLYLLQNVLRLSPVPEPEERRRIDPLERGDLFHRVAERYLRELRDRGLLPVHDTEAARARLAEMAEEALEGLVAGSPPRFTLLWEREKRRFHETVLGWLRREAASAGKSTPAHFELSFGLGVERDQEEPHDPEPLEIDLGDGRSLRVSGRIDRIDRREDGLVLRDYKTGRAPKDDGGVFRGGKQLQIPFYVLAVSKLLPGERVVDAFLDYVDGGRQVAFRPDIAQGVEFRDLLRRLVDLVSRGVFVQEPTACDWCDFTAVCGPKALLQRRQGMKVRDRTLQEFLRLRNIS